MALITICCVPAWNVENYNRKEIVLGWDILKSRFVFSPALLRQKLKTAVDTEKISLHGIQVVEFLFLSKQQKQ